MLNLETPIYNNIYLEQLFYLAKQALGKKDDNTSTFYVMFDEIQYLKDWEVNLKSLVDTYRNVKFIASGSAAAEHKKRSNESGAGRFTDFSLPPLTFYEYIHIRNFQHLIIESSITWKDQEMINEGTSNIDKFNELFIDYINYGGYPEVVFSDTIREDPGQFIRHDIIDKVLLRDLPSIYGISDVQELNSLFTMIAYHSGKQFSYEKLSNESGIRKDLLRKYIEYLEAAYLIKVIHRTDDNAKSYQRETSFKIYLTNPSLRCALFQPLKETDEEMGDMVETTVFAQWMPRLSANISYANWKNGRKDQGEVDIVGINPAKLKPEWAVEIKWTDRFYDNPAELVSLKAYMERNSLDCAMVTTRTQTGLKELPFGKLQFLPVACYAYTVGKNTMRSVKTSYGL